MLKLDIGGGRNPEPGFKVVDIVAGPHVDYVCPAWDIPLPDGSVAYIHARHMLEHLIPKDCQRTLLEWKRLLSSQGTVEAIVPDLLYHAKQLTMKGMSKWHPPRRSNFQHAMDSIYGRFDIGDGMEHKWGYTRATFKRVFESAGFAAALLPSRECDIRIIASKDEQQCQR